MLYMDLQTFGGRGGTGTARDNSKATQTPLSKEQEKTIKKINSAKEWSTVTVWGPDFEAVQKYSDAGEDWASEWIDADREFSGTYIKGEDGWEEAIYASENPLISTKELIDLVKKTINQLLPRKS